MKSLFSLKSSSQRTSAAYKNTTKPSGARVVYLYEEGQPVDGKGTRLEFTPDVCRTLDDVKLLIKQTLNLPYRPAWLKAAHNGKLINSMSEITTDMALIYDGQARRLPYPVSTSSSGSRDTPDYNKTHRKVKSTGTIDVNAVIGGNTAKGQSSTSPVAERNQSASFDVSKLLSRLEVIEARMDDLQRETTALRGEQEKLRKQVFALQQSSMESTRRF
eukprot:jgi/Galph1/3232/GphlegSOOS_G1899.1